MIRGDCIWDAGWTFGLPPPSLLLVLLFFLLFSFKVARFNKLRRSYTRRPIVERGSGRRRAVEASVTVPAVQ